MTTKIVAFGCWSNERHIAVKNDAGIIHSMLFTTPEAAREYYKSFNRSLDNDPIVKVTVEIVG